MKYVLLSILAITLTIAKGQSEEAGAKLFKNVDPSVVSIQIENSGGSGMIVSEDGYIITNGHVIADATNENPLRTSEKITVILYNDKKYKATVIGHSLDPDIALIKINPDEKLKMVTFADSDEVKTGQKSYALGMPTGHKRTLTSGIISNTERYIGTYTTVFQTDAAINPGNSGGPLFNEKGEVIGVNTYAGRGQNQGFTIPSKVALTLKEHYIEYGYFKRATVPFFFTQHLYEELAEKFNVSNGVLIEFVEEDSSAYEAGMRAGDVIIEKNGQPVEVKNVADLLNFEWEMSTQKIGSKLNLVLLRTENNTQIKIPFSSTMIEDEPLPKAGYQVGEIKETSYTEFGLGVMPIVTNTKYMYELSNKNGVIVNKSETNSVAFKADLRVNKDADIITEVDGKQINSITDFITTIDHALIQNKEYIPLKVTRSKLEFMTALKPSYLLKGKTVAIILTNQPSFHLLDRIRRFFISNGAKVMFFANEIKTYNHQPKLRGDIPFKIDVNKTLPSLIECKADVILIAPTSNDEELKTFNIPENIKSIDSIVAGYDNAPVIIFNQFDKFKNKKITADNDYSADLISKSSNFTGNDIETDGQVITSTGLNENIIDRFLEKIKEKLLEKDD